MKPAFHLRGLSIVKARFALLLGAGLILLPRGAPAATAPATAAGVMRAVFVDAFGTQFRDHLSAQRLVKKLEDYQTQRCFLEVWALGEGFYDSKLLPPPAGLPVGYRDPLGDILRMLGPGAQRPVKIHAWISPFQTHNARAILPPPPGHVALMHLDWLTEDYEGNTTDDQGWHYLDPGNLGAQKFIVSVVVELVKQYAVDGLHVEGLRYPGDGARFGYNKGALERYRQETGATGRPDPMDPAWLDWRRRQLTGLLAQITRAVKEIRPEVIVSVSAMADGTAPKNTEGFRFSTPFAQVLQDWVLWAGQGLADWVCLMDFFDEQTEGALFNDWVDFAMANRGQAKIWVGVAGYRNWSIDAFNQIARARARHVDGVAVYNFRQPVRDIAAASDFFAAWQDSTTLSDLRATETLQVAAMPAALRQRLDRMIRAAETATTEGETPELAPGIGVLPASRPAAAPRPSSAPSVPAAAVSVAARYTSETLPAEYASAEEGVPGRRPPFLDPWDTVVLRNQNRFEGHKIGEMNGETLFETSSGIIIKIGNQYIERVRRGAGEE